MMIFVYVVASYLAGVFFARSNYREGNLLSTNSKIAVWGTTALFFVVFLFFGVPGTPPAWTTLGMPLGYFTSARNIKDNEGPVEGS